MKKKYKKLFIKVTIQEDVIVTSFNGEVEQDEDELPFVPF